MADEIDVIMAGLDDLTEREVIRLTLDLTEGLVLNTPVDIGWARAGWVPTIAKPYTGGTDLSPDPAKVATARAEQERAQGEILNYKLAQGVTWVANNVTYILPLNEGWSKQAPAGFVQSTIAATIAFGGYGTETVERSSFTYRPGR